MKAITVCEPMGSAIMFGGKPIENRKRRLPIQGAVMIHAGLSLSWFTAEVCGWLHERWPGCPSNHILAMHKFQHRLGKVIGVAYFDGGYAFDQGDPRPAWFTRDHGRWATGPYCHRIRGVIPVKPFKATGRQGPFTIPGLSLPADVIAAAEQLDEQFKDRGQA